MTLLAKGKSTLLSAKALSPVLILTLLALTVAARAQGGIPAQSSVTPQQAASPEAATQRTEPSQGTVLFQSHGEPPSSPPSVESLKDWQTTEKASGAELTDAEREAVTFTAYDMDVRLVPAMSGMSARARLSLRNDSKSPLARVALQISSTLRWESASLVTPEGSTKLKFAQHLIDTDADHTGRANEVVVDLPQVLEPGQVITLDTFYSGTAGVSTGRLERLGASQAQAVATDWDGVRTGHTALRGFGNVLWYPVASPQLFLGEGAQLFEAIGRTELRQRDASIRFRVGVEYSGSAPAAVYFCGRRQPLVAQSDSPESSSSVSSGIATAEFNQQSIGFRLPSLFVIEKQEMLLAPLPDLPGEVQPSISSSSAAQPAHEGEPAAETTHTNQTATATEGDAMVAVESNDDRVFPALTNSAQLVAPLLQTWLGEKPLSTLTVIDNSGQPFEDGPLLVAPVGSLVSSAELPAMAHGLTHAWVQTGQPWMDEGLAQFFALLWVERTQGREAAVLQLNNLLQPVAIAEPNIEEGKISPPGQPLISATSETFFRRKAAAVWFMLRAIAGEDALKRTLRAWRTQASSAPSEEQARDFETLLEKQSGKDLRWFFDDWVLRDRGLPDLSITSVASRQLAAGNGHNTGWLVAVTVHNDGAAAAEVPVAVHSGSLNITSTIRVLGFSSGTARVMAEAAPTEVVVNDGSTPELQNVRHVRQIVPATQNP